MQAGPGGWQRGEGGVVGWQCVHTQLCRSASVHSECVCVCNGMCGMQSRSCHCCLPLLLLPSPILPATPTRSALSGQQLLFSNGRQGNKSFAHSPHFQPPLLLPLPPLLTHNKLTAIKRFCQHAAGMGQNLRADGGGGVARCSSCLHRPENYSAHKLLNAKSFDFNYVENFYCPRRGLRMRKRRTFAQLLRLPGCVCLSVFRIFPLSSAPLSPPRSLFVSLCVCGFFRDSARQAN